MADDDTQEPKPKTTASLAEEIAAETKTLNTLLGQYASKADVQRQLETERAATKIMVVRRDRWRNIALTVIALGLVGSLAIGLWAKSVGDQAKRATVRNAQLAADLKSLVDQQAADRLRNSRGSCIQFNVDQKNKREAQVQGLVDTFRLFVTDTSKLDDFAAAYRARLEVLLPYRDCSDAGVDKFLKNPPPDPATTTTTVPGG